MLNKYLHHDVEKAIEDICLNCKETRERLQSNNSSEDLCIVAK